ncbi:MAG: hypothetical protein COU71_01305 [Parcubacteria group bacterium CG10_big_fil_rev_8_21_14_0_10_38_31]|nr:MAG: hypothetical protein COU71_01305 [Parcubacteria group bacterium CG10_big_fil_rev_8_21_14_0_10_38_31]
MMNNNFKTFFRKLIWSFVALYIGAFFPFLGYKFTKLIYVNIENPGINLRLNLADASSSLNNLFLSYKKDNLNEYPSVETNTPLPVFDDIALVETIDVVNEDDKKDISFTFVGDIMLDRNVENSVYKNGKGDFSFIFENVDFLAESDITFGNLEGPMSDKGEDLGNLYSFRMNPAVALSLKGTGFDVLSVANNHSADWGKDAFLDTLNRLNLSGIVSVGGGIDRKDAENLRIIERSRAKVGFIAFSDIGPKWFEAGDNNPGILLAKTELVQELVRKAKGQVDYIVVSFHFGNEYETVPNSRQERFARLAIDSGANIVVGHHPHVVQKIELYNGGLIAYSLGNFIFDQNFSEETMEGALLNVVFKGRDIVSIYKKKVKLNKFFQVYLSDYDD